MGGFMDNKRHNLILLMGGIFTTIFIVLGTMSYNVRINDELQALTMTALKEISLKQQFILNEDINSNSELLNLLATTVGASSNMDIETTLEYIDIVEEISSFKHINIVGVDGIGITANNEKIDISNEPYFTEMINGNYISNIITSSFSNEDVIMLSIPIEKNGEIQGYVAGEYNISNLESLLTSAFDGQSFIFVLDATGAIIAQHTNELTQPKVNMFEIFKDQDLTDKVLDAMQKGESTNVVYTFNEDTRIGEICPINFNGWSLIYILPEQVIDDYTQNIMEQVNLFTFGMVIVLVLLVFITSFAQRNTFNTIRMLAYYDELTGLPNLVKFKMEANQLLVDNPDKDFSIVKLDINNFKAINELYGHDTGNKVLRALADVVHTDEIPNYTYAKIAVDEFLLLGPSEFFSDLSNELSLDENKFKEAVSFIPFHHIKLIYGRYKIEEDENDIDKIIAKVDIAHKTAKSKKNIYFCDYDENFKKTMLKAAEITNKMEVALEHKEFKVVLQPKYDTITEQPVGAEALVRWIEDNGKMIFPDEFIPLFESNGFITKLDKYMLEEVCILIRQWIDNGITPIPISVNFSRVHINNPNFTSEIKAIIDKYNVNTKYIEIELTESTILDNESELKTIFENFKTSHLVIAMDDFGYGYSSLGFLKDFDVDIIKLDRSFFSFDADNERSRIVIRNIVKMVKELGVVVVAEGVETKEQLDFLKSTRCDMVQGYYFSKPIPIKDFNKNILGADF